MKLLLSVELPGQTGWQLPADWAAALLAALRQTLALEYPAGRPGSENYGSCEVSLTLTDIIVHVCLHLCTPLRKTD